MIDAKGCLKLIGGLALICLGLYGIALGAVDLFNKWAAQ